MIIKRSILFTLLKDLYRYHFYTITLLLTLTLLLLTYLNILYNHSSSIHSSAIPVPSFNHDSHHFTFNTLSSSSSASSNNNHHDERIESIVPEDDTQTLFIKNKSSKDHKNETIKIIDNMDNAVYGSNHNVSLIQNQDEKQHDNHVEQDSTINPQLSSTTSSPAAVPYNDLEKQVQSLQQQNAQKQQYIDDLRIQTLIDRCTHHGNAMITRIASYNPSYTHNSYSHSQSDHSHSDHTLLNNMYLSECYPLEIHLSAEQRTPAICNIIANYIYHCNARLSPILPDHAIYQQHTQKCTTTTYLHINDQIVHTLLPLSHHNAWLLTDVPSKQQIIKNPYNPIVKMIEQQTMMGRGRPEDRAGDVSMRMQNIYITKKSIEKQMTEYIDAEVRRSSSSSDGSDPTQQQQQNSMRKQRTAVDTTTPLNLNLQYLAFPLPDLLLTSIHNPHVYADMQRILLVAEVYHDRQFIDSIIQCWRNHPHYPLLTVLDRTNYRIQEEDDISYGKNIHMISGQGLTTDDYYLLKRINGIHLYISPNTRRYDELYYTALQESCVLGSCIVSTKKHQRQHYDDDDGVLIHQLNSYLLASTDGKQIGDDTKKKRNKLFVANKDISQNHNNLCKQIDEFLTQHHPRCDEWGNQMRSEYKSEKEKLVHYMKTLNHELRQRRYGRSDQSDEDLLWLMNHHDFNLKRSYFEL